MEEVTLTGKKGVLSSSRSERNKLLKHRMNINAHVVDSLYKRFVLAIKIGFKLLLLALELVFIT